MPQDSENYYDDSPAATPASQGGAPKEEEGDTEGQTFIVPRSAFGGRDIKPGDKCDIEVKAVHENDVECLPCEPGSHDEEGEQPPAQAPAPPSEMAGMME